MDDSPNTDETVSVVIDQVIPLPERESDDPAVTNPLLMTFRKGTVPKSTKDITLSVRKRKHPTSPSATIDVDAPLPKPAESELFAHARDGRIWQAESGFNHVNCNYFIGVRRKSTGRMSIVQVDGLYSLRPYMAHLTGNAPMNANTAEEDKDVEEKTAYEKRRDLLEAFGGKRSIQRLRRVERDYISDEKVDARTAQEITEATKKMVAKDAEEGIIHNKVETTASMAPPHDVTATTPMRAYPLEGLLSPQEMGELSDAAGVLIDGFAEGLADENPGWHPLVWSVVTSIIQSRLKGTSSAKDDGCSTRVQCAMHVHYLITLARAKRMITQWVRVQLMEDMAVSEETLGQLLERFTSSEAGAGSLNEVRVRTDADMDRIGKYAIVMWMYALGFSNCGRLGELADALGLSLKSMLWFAKSIGCKMKKLKDAEGPAAFRITLKTPLVFPPVQARKLGNKRRRSE